MNLLRLCTLITSITAICWATSCRSGGPKPPSLDSLQETARNGRLIGKPGGALRYRIGSPPQTFNYLMAVDDSTLIVAFYLMGGRLVEFDHDTHRYLPALAEKWTAAGDGRTLDLSLRQGLKFSDGRPLTAEDVRFTFRALYDQRTASPLFGPAMTIGGAQIQVSVQDPSHLRLVFPQPVAVPESYLSNLAVLPRHLLEKSLEQGAFREAYSLLSDPSQIATAGAFIARAVVPGERVVLRRNPHYWKRDEAGAPLPYLDEVVIEVAGEANNAFARLVQGSLDLYDRIRPADYAALLKQPGVVNAVDAGPGLSTDYLWFNLNAGKREGQPLVNPMKRAWFNDLRFRRAISHSIDRETLARVTLQGLATPLYNFVSPGNREWVATGLARTDYDLEKARALLREAGFTQSGEPDRPELRDAAGNRVELTMIVPVESQPRMQMAAVVQEDWARLGIKVNVAPIEFGDLQRRISQTYDYEAALLGAIVSEPDPSSYVNLLGSSSPSQHWYPRQTRPGTAWESRIDELLEAQARETMLDRRRAIFREIQTILADQLPVIPLTARHVICAANRRIGNFRPSAFQPFAIWNAEELFVR